jgi:hypothetical protein
MDQLTEKLALLSSALRDVCTGMNSGRMVWPEAEARLRDACVLVEDVQQHVTTLRNSYSVAEEGKTECGAYRQGYVDGLAAHLRILTGGADPVQRKHPL